jgi:hypothetical protein
LFKRGKQKNGSFYEKETLFCERLFDFLKNMSVNQGYIILEQILWFFEKGDNQIKEPP